MAHPYLNREQHGGEWRDWPGAPDEAEWGFIGRQASQLIDASAPHSPAWRRGMDDWLIERRLANPANLECNRAQHWVRVQVCARIGARNLCELCKTEPPSEPEVHRLNYDYIGRERLLHDVAFLCAPCHLRVTSHPHHNECLIDLRAQERWELGPAYYRVNALRRGE